jgi:uncharacterized phiE125 gp8 family phage protein
MGLSLITPPASMPVTLEEAKAQCRVEDDSEDSLMTGLIGAATDYVEQYTGRALVSQTWRLTLDAFADSILLPKGPVQSVSAITYFDTAGDVQTLDASNYTADITSDPSWVVINSDAALPHLMDAVNVVRVDFVAGYSTLPASIKQAILLLIGQWFDNRSDVTDKAMIAMPNAVEALLTNYRSYSF